MKGLFIPFSIFLFLVLVLFLFVDSGGQPLICISVILSDSEIDAGQSSNTGLSLYRVRQTQSHMDSSPRVKQHWTPEGGLLVHNIGLHQQSPVQPNFRGRICLTLDGKSISV